MRVQLDVDEHQYNMHTFAWFLASSKPFFQRRIDLSFAITFADTEDAEQYRWCFCFEATIRSHINCNIKIMICDQCANSYQRRHWNKLNSAFSCPTSVSDAQWWQKVRCFWLKLPSFKLRRWFNWTKGGVVSKNRNIVNLEFVAKSHWYQCCIFWVQPLGIRWGTRPISLWWWRTIWVCSHHRALNPLFLCSKWYTIHILAQNFNFSATFEEYANTIGYGCTLSILADSICIP